MPISPCYGSGNLKGSDFMKTRILAVVGLFLTLSVSCVPPTTKGTGGATSPTPVAPNTDPPLTFLSEDFSGDPLLCTYRAQGVNTGSTTLTRVTVFASGTTPTGVTVERSNSQSNVTGDLGVPTGSWESTGHVLDCNTPLGCASGDYRVDVKYGIGSIGSCPAPPRLTLQLN